MGIAPPADADAIIRVKILCLIRRRVGFQISVALVKLGLFDFPEYGRRRNLHQALRKLVIQCAALVLSRIAKSI